MQSASSEDNAEEQFDVNFALMSGELAQLIADLTAALGAETTGTNTVSVNKTPVAAQSAR
jgi:DNA recombination-dependent growth factor C